MSSIRTLVLLKYEMPTLDQKTWSLCETYPAEVRKNWAWRCALDVGHLAAGYKEAERCIDVAKKYRVGLATIEELNASGAAAHAVHAVHAARAQAHAAASAAATTGGIDHTVKWVKYIEWLIEELCIWEENQ